LLVACGAAGGGDTPDSPDRTAAEVALAYERASCENLVYCKAVPDLDTCLATSFAERSWRTKAMTDAVAAGEVVIDQDAVDSCLEWTGRKSCTFDFSDDPRARACMEMYEGQLAAGAACVLQSQCGPGLHCALPDTCKPGEACCAGTCAELPELPALPAVGEDCSETFACANGAWCHVKEDNTGVCEALGKEGQPCPDLTACELDLVCDLPLGGTDGTCVRPAATGAACSPDAFGACASLYDFCDAESRTCNAPKAAGEACASSGECQVWTVCLAGKCTAGGLVGEACSAEHRCQGELRCEGGTCQAPADQPTCPR
jgi:hypothetical protein